MNKFIFHLISLSLFIFTLFAHVESCIDNKESATPLDRIHLNYVAKHLLTSNAMDETTSVFNEFLKM